MRLLRQYSWPGNVRQLLAALESAAISAGEGGRIEAQHLPDEIREAQDTTHGARYQASAAPDDERAAIEAALAHTGGTLSRAAELLGMGRTTLWRKMRAYGIVSPRRTTPCELGARRHYANSRARTGPGSSARPVQNCRYCLAVLPRLALQTPGRLSAAMWEQAYSTAIDAPRSRWGRALHALDAHSGARGKAQ